MAITPYNASALSQDPNFFLPSALYDPTLLNFNAFYYPQPTQPTPSFIHMQPRTKLEPRKRAAAARRAAESGPPPGARIETLPDGTQVSTSAPAPSTRFDGTRPAPGTFGGRPLTPSEVYAQEMAELPTNTSQFIMSPEEQDARELARARAAAAKSMRRLRAEERGLAGNPVAGGLEVHFTDGQLKHSTTSTGLTPSEKYRAEMRAKWAEEKAAGEQRVADRIALERIIAEDTAALYGETGENAMALLNEAIARGASFDELYPISRGIHLGEIAAQSKRRARYEQNIADIERRESDTMMNRATERAMDDMANRYRSQQAEEAHQRALAAYEKFKKPFEPEPPPRGNLRGSVFGLPMIGY
jgi:hypothetical protein